MYNMHICVCTCACVRVCEGVRARVCVCKGGDDMVCEKCSILKIREFFLYIFENIVFISCNYLKTIIKIFFN